MDKTLQTIRESLGHMTMKWKPSVWLDTKIPDLNRVMGDEDYGIPYGRIVEISGWESVGKSAIMLAFAALAQLDGAFVIWGDFENSFNPKWALQRGMAPCPKCKGEAGRKNGIPCSGCGGSEEKVMSPTRGLDTSKLILIQPYVGNFTTKGKDGKMHKEKEARLATAQEMLVETEEAMKLGHPKTFCVIDSVAALLPEGEALAGIVDANMKTDMDLAKLMGRVLRRWVGTAQVHNVLIALVSQLREGPAKFGDGTKTSGGNAPKFYAHIRVRARRVKGGRLRDAGKIVGIMGVIKAVKNKAGGVEGAECGYRILFKGPLEFIAAKIAKAEETESGE